MAARAGSKTIFIGNISYDVTESELAVIFSEVGPLISLRLMSDRETGKPKGFAFAEYRDSETAQSAARHLNGRELKGRQLRVDMSEQNTTGLRVGPPGGPDGGAGPRSGYDGQQQGVLPPHLQPIGQPAAAAAAAAIMGGGGGGGANGHYGPPGSDAGAADAVTQALGAMSRKQLYDVMAQMRALAEANPGRARAVLAQHPQLTRALFQAQLMLGLVAAAPGVVIAPPAGGGVGQVPPPPPPLPDAMMAGPGGAMGGVPLPPPPSIMQPVLAQPGGMGMPPGGMVRGGMPTGGYPGGDMGGGYGMPGGALAQQQQQLQQQQMMMMQQGGGGPPMAAMGPQVPGGGAAPMNANQQQVLMMQVMSLTPQQIEMLPPAQRATVLQLRSQMVG